MIIALIPARGGSKRLPRKNILNFYGNPLIKYSILAGKYSKNISKIVVSTDDNEIQSFSSNQGVEVLKRTKELSGDLTSTSEVLRFVVIQLNLNPEDWIVTLQPTSPLRPINLIDEMIDFAKSKSKWDSIISVSPLRHKVGTLDELSYFKNMNYNLGQRSQDMNDEYLFENGLIYITKVSTLIDCGNMFGNLRIGYITDLVYSGIDIDNHIDFKIGELVYSEFKGKYNLI